ncbi:hypothetical protein LOTGIDRAFT_165470 [Lottia gigantea]|uniref:Major facilitator superfamily (MFS) profile domain-containing protein n=1 Tax=Lottia gigantea TaxID=225164 RepID=V3ZC98_LOTGI|nr:hypothetical protein LOTGIDRAFT_165470 [Lottia gigantea]ESO88683.1 hypothetical protein LOTGIDRAFT_165470 [Lottia gigantea]
MENQSSSERNSRFIQTLWLTYAFSMNGFNNGILGPALLDLQFLVKVNLDTISNLFIVSGVGFIIGNVTAMVLKKYVDTELFLGLSVLFGSVINIVLLVVPVYAYVVIMTLLQGIFKGVIGFCVLIMCNVIWKDNKSFAFQFVCIGGGISSFIVPFIAKPFLSETHFKHSTDSDVYTECQNTTNPPLSADCYTFENTNVQWAYVIVGLIMIPPAISFLYYYHRSRKQTNVPYEEFDNETKPSKASMINNQSTYFFLVLLFIFHIPIFGFCLAFGGLLTEFGVISDFHYTKSTMAIMTSMYWGSFVFGRIVNLIFSQYINLFVVLTVNLAGLLCATTMLVLATVSRPIIFWIGTVLIGLFSSSLLPTALVWSDKYVPVSGFTITTTLIASGMGDIVLPRIGGAVFDTEGPPSLMIMMLVAALFELAFFIGLALVGNSLVIKSQPSEDEQSKQIVKEEHYTP